eukprot:1158741-Pelagomonas_calceolata.AAC.9
MAEIDKATLGSLVKVQVYISHPSGPQRSPMLLRGRNAAETTAVGGAGQGSWEHGGSRAGQTRRVDGPHSHSFSQGGPQRGCCSCYTKSGGQGQGAWMVRLSEPMEVSEDTTDETMEGRGE